jgi:serpin B
MMEQTNSFLYYADENLQCVELPYGNQAFGMVVILGENDMSIDRLIDYLDETTWQNITDNMRSQKVWLKLPRFKTECDMDLKKPVYNLGMQRIFEGGLTNIGDAPWVVSVIKQKTFVEVNEEGTEAAAVTQTGLDGAYFDPNIPVEFFADRPFLYLIKEKSTGAILFIGRMDEPHE